MPIKVMIEVTFSSVFTCPSNLVRLKTLASMSEFTIPRKLLMTMTKRSIFMPPEVEPEQPHTNEQSMSTPMLPEGHKLVSAVAKPVVVDSEQTWKAAIRKAFGNVR